MNAVEAKVSFLGIAAKAAQNHSMMRVFVNRSARQRSHAAVGGQRTRRCGSAGTVPALRLSVRLRLLQNIFCNPHAFAASCLLRTFCGVLAQFTALVVC